MYRKAMSQLLEWKAAKDRKPLILTGARQVGKTWLLEEFGRLHYEKVAYVLMAENPRMQKLFENVSDARALISGLEAELGFSIAPENTLIILDEAQEIPKTITSLKYFCEQAPEYHIAVAGSMLGVALHAGISYPVGKVNSLTLYPMTFSEFVRAVKSEQLAEMLQAPNQAPNYALRSSFHDSFNELLKQYLFIGGMPEVVNSFANMGDYHAARAIQKQILADYERDFSKHAPVNVVPRIRMVWNSLPSQLARENKKFVYGAMRPGARAKDFELAIQWLLDAGIVIKAQRLRKVAAPLKHYEDPSAFKLFLVDVGLLGALSNLESRLLLEGDRFFTEFKGANTEQFVAEQLIAAGLSLYYHTSDDAKTELDFVVEVDGRPIPVEVKSAGNLHSKSLSHFVNKHSIERAIKLSLLEEKRNELILNVPLYLAEYIVHQGA